MDYSEVKELIGIVDASSLTDFQLTMDNVAVSMSKLEKGISVNNGGFSAGETSAVPSVNLQTAGALASSQAVSVPHASAPVAAAPLPVGEVVKAPIVGTFYASSGVGKEDFVKCGSVVSAGDTLCILEAMKIMNEIVSPCNGKIAEIYVQNEALVEFGQPLFCIIP